MPIVPTSTATEFPADLGAFTAGNQSITFTNPTKTITDIKLGGATTAASYSVSSGTKISMQIGTTSSVIPNGISVRGAAALPGAAATASTYKGQVTIKNLAAGAFPAPAPTVLTVTVSTLD